MMKTLETERLILRKLKEDDFEEVHSYMCCPETGIYLPWCSDCEEEARSYIRLAIDEAEKTSVYHYHYAAVVKETGKLIGGCRVSCDGSLYWVLHRGYWNQGFGVEMGRAMIQYGFKELNLHRLFATCDADNLASYKLMEKLGMRREGLFIEALPAHKLTDRQYSDQLRYAILKDEWETHQEIEYYNALPVNFDGFIELPELSDGVIHLVCTAKKPAIPEKKYVPVYDFAVCKGSEKVGGINLRIGYAGFGPDLSSLYYGGQIGYSIDEAYRGNGYAGCACRLLLPVARAHGMKKLLITNNVSNTASRRVCEKLGLKFVRVARLPEWHDLHKEGQRYINIFEWDVETS
ncbi:MAG: GNAT family N-acetyltransferase [Defluviitaleaceae bacterium]|nr:GNAT family N-acetyltransferase [Defluviitaleaceae bacterium]